MFVGDCVLVLVCVDVLVGVRWRLCSSYCVGVCVGEFVGD